MDADAGRIFEDGLKDAESIYEQVFEDAKGGVGTWLTTWGDDWEELIEDSLATARQAYLRRVDQAIDAVADCVDAKLKAAKDCVTAGRTQVDTFVKGLDEQRAWRSARRRQRRRRRRLRRARNRDRLSAATR